MISEYEAVQRAKDFIVEKLGKRLEFVLARFQQDPTKLMRKHGFTFDPSDERVRPCWSVTFKATTDREEILEGGVIVDVDAETGASRLFDEAFSQNGVTMR